MSPGLLRSSTAPNGTPNRANRAYRAAYSNGPSSLGSIMAERTIFSCLQNHFQSTTFWPVLTRPVAVGPKCSSAQGLLGSPHLPSALVVQRTLVCMQGTLSSFPRVQEKKKKVDLDCGIQDILDFIVTSTYIVRSHRSMSPDNTHHSSLKPYPFFCFPPSTICSWMAPSLACMSNGILH